MKIDKFDKPLISCEILGEQGTFWRIAYFVNGKERFEYNDLRELG